MREKSRFIDAKIVDDKSNNDNNAKKIIATYEEERTDGWYHHIVSVPIFFNDGPSIDIYFSNDSFPFNETFVNLGFGSMKISPQNKVEVKDILIKERVEELTIEDIEKKLGHKIKIVNNKE